MKVYQANFARLDFITRGVGVLPPTICTATCNVKHTVKTKLPFTVHLVMKLSEGNDIDIWGPNSQVSRRFIFPIRD